MQNKGFLFVFLGALAECGWAYGLKHADSNLEYFLTGVMVCVSFYMFILGFKRLDTSVAYTLFVGLGTFFLVVVEAASELYHSGSVNLWRLFFIATLVIGVLGIKGAKS